MKNLSLSILFAVNVRSALLAEREFTQICLVLSEGDYLQGGYLGRI